MYQGSSYSNQNIDDIKIICYNRKIHLPQILHRSVLYWYHFYLNNSGGSILEKISGYATGKSLSHKNIRILSRAIYVNSSKKEILFMEVCNPKTTQK